MAKKVSEEVWKEIIRLRLVDDIPIRELAKRFGVPSSTIHSRTKTGQIEQVKTLANQIVDISQQYHSMDDFGQKLTSNLAAKLNNISCLAADVAEAESLNARKLSAIKSTQILNLDVESPDLNTIALIKVLGETVNDAMKPAQNLMAANKAFIDKVNSEESVAKQHTRIERIIVSAKNAVT